MNSASPTPLSRVRRLLASPVTRTDLLQLLKSSVAAVVAWVLADRVLGLPQAFLAAWVALLTVHATVHRTLWRGLATVVAVALGVLLSFAVVETLGSSAWSLGVAVFLGLLLGRLPGIRAEGVTVATTVLFVVIAGAHASEAQVVASLPDRLLDTAIGVAVAVVVNLVVVPPLNDVSAQQQVDDVDRRLGALLQDMAAQLEDPAAAPDEEDWIERTRSLDADLEHAWSLVRSARESRLWNPRRLRHPDDGPGQYAEILTRLEEGVAQTRSIARHLRDSTRAAHEWDVRFRSRFLPLLAETGRRVADPDADVAELRDELDDIVRDLSTADLPGLLWPLYGALVANLRVVLEVVDDVASARPVRT